MADRSRWFVSTAWLADRVGDPGVVVIDGSWHLPTLGRDAAAEYRQAHIPGAVFFDIDRVADRSSPLPHMLPSPDAFAAAVGAMGIDSRQPIVVYDSVGLSSAPRVWWTFRVMGAGNVRILDGGLPAWLAEGRPVHSGDEVRPPQRFRASFDADAVVGYAEVAAALRDGSAQMVDGRPAARFKGEAREPRPGVRSGHAPGSLSLPGTDLVTAGRLNDEQALAHAFAAAGIDLSRPIHASCGSGVVAATLVLAADILGASRVALYDGSWTDWGGRADTPVVTGA